MKNKAVEQLIRTQHNIPKDQQVSVEFISVVDGTYEYACDWSKYSDAADDLQPVATTVFIKSTVR